MKPVAEPTDGTTRERILGAATRLFGDHGFDQTSIRDITEAADANVAAINYHFGSKENLYIEVFRQHSEEMRQIRTAAVAEAAAQPGGPGLRAMLHGFVGMTLQRILGKSELASFARLAFREISNPGPAFELLYREFIQPNHQALHGAILKAAPGMDPRRATLCVASVYGLMLHFVRARQVITRLLDQPYDDELIEEICEHIVDFSIGGMGVS